MWTGSDGFELNESSSEMKSSTSNGRSADSRRLSTSREIIICVSLVNIKQVSIYIYAVDRRGMMNTHEFIPLV